MLVKYAPYFVVTVHVLSGNYLGAVEVLTTLL